MNSSYHGVTAVCSSKVNNITFAIVTADRDFIEADFECLGGMLMFLNTFDACQSDIYPPPPSRLASRSSVSHCLSPLLFCPCFLFCPKTFETNEAGLIYSYGSLNIHLPVVPVVFSRDTHTVDSLSAKEWRAVSGRRTCYALYLMTDRKLPLGYQLSSWKMSTTLSCCRTSKLSRCSRACTVTDLAPQQSPLNL